MEMMDQEKQEAAATPPLPVLPRLDRLDRLLQLLEEKHNLSSGRHLWDNNGVNEKVRQQQEDARVPLSSALEQVHHKGTLMERLAMLENRVLKLSLDVDIIIEGSTSYNSTISSTNNLIIPVSDENMAEHYSSVSSSVTSLEEEEGEEDKMITSQETQGRTTAAPHALQGEASTAEEKVAEKKGQDIERRERKKSFYRRKWFFCLLPTRC